MRCDCHSLNTWFQIGAVVQDLALSEVNQHCHTVVNGGPAVSDVLGGKPCEANHRGICPLSSEIDS